eukprot:scaffold1318_cov388-Prasinococcus_capsulatus_cf.AAC.12
MRKHGKTHEGAEYARRLEIFGSNARLALRNQLLDPSAQHGLTPFADLTPEEFQAQFMGLRSDARERALGPNSRLLRCGRRTTHRRTPGLPLPTTHRLGAATGRGALAHNPSGAPAAAAAAATTAARQLRGSRGSACVCGVV